MLGATVFSPTYASSPEAVVGSARRYRSGTRAGSTRRSRTALPRVPWLLASGFSSRGALVRLYSSRVYFQKPYHAVRLRWSTSIDRSVLWITFPQVYELVRLIVNLASYLYAEYGDDLRRPLRALTYDLSLGLWYGEAKRRAQDHDHAHRIPELLGQMQDDSGIVSEQHAPQRRRQGCVYVRCSPPPPRPRSPSEFFFLYNTYGRRTPTC